SGTIPGRLRSYRNLNLQFRSTTQPSRNCPRITFPRVLTQLGVNRRSASMSLLRRASLSGRAPIYFLYTVQFFVTTKVVGQPMTPPNPSTTASSPTKTVYLVPNCFALGAISSCGETAVIPTIRTSLFLYSSYKRLNFGISAMHGSHHVAQISMTDTLPSKSADLVVPPAMFSSSNSGALLLPGASAGTFDVHESKAVAVIIAAASHAFLITGPCHDGRPRILPFPVKASLEISPFPRCR